VPVAQSISVGDKDLEGVELKVTSGVRVSGFVNDRLNERVSSVNITLKPDPGNAMLESDASPRGPGLVVFVVPIPGQPAPVSPAPTVSIVNRLVTQGKNRAMVATVAGEFSFTGVLPGKYTLEANPPGGKAFGRQIEVGVHEAVAIELDLPLTQVVGRIVDSGGAALPLLTGSVRFVSAEPDARIVFGFPDDTGRFTVLLAPGEYRLFTDTLNIDSSIESISDGENDLQVRRFVVDGNRQQQIRITIAR
jgi:hypothetical protein